MSDFKYSEDTILKELHEYIEKTYKQHYVNEKNLQALDFIDAVGDAVPFTRGNIFKYASRLGKKPGEEEKDLFKIMHYAILLTYFYRMNKE